MRALIWQVAWPLAVLCAVVEAAFTPRNRTELQTAMFGCVGACGQALSVSYGVTVCPSNANGPWGQGNGTCNNAKNNVPTGQGSGPYGVIGAWDVSKVTIMRGMFGFAGQFNQPLGAWDVSRVTSMIQMFLSAGQFNHPLGSWDVAKVTNMLDMFSVASQFNQPLGTWDVSKVTGMGSMFAQAGQFNQPLGAWDVSKVTNMGGMFYSAGQFNQGKFCGESWVNSTASQGYMFDGVIKGSISEDTDSCNCTCANGVAATGPECTTDNTCDYLRGGRGDDSGSNHDSGSYYNDTSSCHNVSANYNSSPCHNNISAHYNSIAGRTGMGQ